MSMEKSMRLGSEIIEKVMEEKSPNELKKLRKGDKKRILVIEGSYDQMEKILNNAKIPYTLRHTFPEKEELRQGGIYFNSKVIFVNCDNSYHSSLDQKNLSRENKSSLIDFVENGGRIVTTDWAQSVVKYLFGKITAKESVTDDEVVKVNFTSDIAKRISGIHYGNATPSWWLEGSSDLVNYRKDSGIISLAESDELKKRYGSKNISFGFTHGNGEVFHFVSHLIAQRTDKYNLKERKCLSSFLDSTLTSIKGAKKTKLSFGEIETAYTLMYTVLTLCGDNKILSGGRDGN